MSSATITTSARLMNFTPQTEEQAMVRKVAVSSFLGNFIEWFDYASYSYFATTIALVFFPTDNHTVAMLQTFGVFALSFILRPIGALFWGSYGDKKGRKAALAHSIMFMSGASFLIGCLPSYSVIGVGAPILLLLLRMVQGFSASGEYAGAATFLGEYAPTSKRGIYCSLIPASTAIGLLAGSTLATLMTANDGTLSSYLTETFPTSVRFTGFAFSFNLANAIFGGTASFIATGLIALTGSSIAPAWYMVGVAAIALVAMILSHENTDKDLNHI